MQQQQQQQGVGQLIDLGSDITAVPPTQPLEGVGTADDIMTQFAELGITSSPSHTAAADSMANGMQQKTEQDGQGQDEFDMFAQSRTAYGTQKG